MPVYRILYSAMNEVDQNVGTTHSTKMSELRSFGTLEMCGFYHNVGATHLGIVGRLIATKISVLRTLGGC